MNQAHVHLWITHLPIIGSILGIFVLAYALVVKSFETKIAAYCIFIISSIGASIAYLTGEGAEEVVENIQGVIESTIEPHEDFAVIALVSLIILGVASAGGIVVSITKSSMSRTAALLILLIAIISAGLIGRTGYLGGQIRHTEIQNNGAIDSNQSSDDEDDD
jgi:DMSO reductase anchor subunit